MPYTKEQLGPNLQQWMDERGCGDPKNAVCAWCGEEFPSDEIAGRTCMDDPLCDWCVDEYKADHAYESLENYIDMED